MARTVLFVCTGNTCRSPMAHYYAAHRALQTGLPLTVTSGGTNAGEGVAANSVTVLRGAGLDVENGPGAISKHTARYVDSDDVQQATAIVCMTDSHRQGLLQGVPEAADKTVLLMHYLGQPQTDIADPFGSPLDVYEKVFSEMIKPAVDALLAKAAAGGSLI
eukprot:TRINITY_DN55223_c0_g1_i1.p2 TRINITY_DN55223_c0_g1~~TRINITY_DN55223_c0_g1_i1.p2  ORF type:complete len:186 (+),score=63.06 TRINITY_DN55223_c0_g1_i1:75-560(+)